MLVPIPASRRGDNEEIFPWLGSRVIEDKIARNQRQALGWLHGELEKNARTLTQPVQITNEALVQVAAPEGDANLNGLGHDAWLINAIEGKARVGTQTPAAGVASSGVDLSGYDVSDAFPSDGERVLADHPSPQGDRTGGMGDFLTTNQPLGDYLETDQAMGDFLTTSEQLGQIPADTIQGVGDYLETDQPLGQIPYGDIVGAWGANGLGQDAPTVIETVPGPDGTYQEGQPPPLPIDEYDLEGVDRYVNYLEGLGQVVLDYPRSR